MYKQMSTLSDRLNKQIDKKNSAPTAIFNINWKYILIFFVKSFIQFSSVFFNGRQNILSIIIIIIILIRMYTTVWHLLIWPKVWKLFLNLLQTNTHILLVFQSFWKIPYVFHNVWFNFGMKIINNEKCIYF